MTLFSLSLLFLFTAKDQRYFGRVCGLPLLLFPALIGTGSHCLQHGNMGTPQTKMPGVLHLSVRVQLAASSPLLPLPFLEVAGDALHIVSRYTKRASMMRQKEQSLPLYLLPAHSEVFFSALPRNPSDFIDETVKEPGPNNQWSAILQAVLEMHLFAHLERTDHGNVLMQNKWYASQASNATHLQLRKWFGRLPHLCYHIW